MSLYEDQYIQSLELQPIYDRFGNVIMFREGRPRKIKIVRYFLYGVEITEEIEVVDNEN